MGLFIIIFICFIVGAFISSSITEEKNNKLQSESSIFWDFDEKTGTLTIIKRHPSFKGLLKYEEYESTQLRYMKEEYIFTSASSGGITVGGVDKIGGYKNEKIKTNTYEMRFYYEGNNSFVVKRIILYDSLLDEAKKSPTIKNYIVNDYIEVVKNKIEPDAWTLSKASPTVRSILEEQAIIDTLPSKEKCKNIITWLSNQQPDTPKISNLNVESENNNIHEISALLEELSTLPEEVNTVSDKTNFIEDIKKRKVFSIYIKGFGDSESEFKESLINNLELNSSEVDKIMAELRDMNFSIICVYVNEDKINSLKDSFTKLAIKYEMI